MGLEVALMAGALAVSVAGTASSMASSSAAAGNAKAQAGAQNQHNFEQQQLLELQKVLASADTALNRSALEDQRLSAGLEHFWFTRMHSQSWRGSYGTRWG
jgi:hypothetical protein